MDTNSLLKHKKEDLKFISEEEFSHFINRIRDSQTSQSLFVVIGAGVSISQLYPDWDQYVDSLINFWRFNLGIIPESEPSTKNRDSLMRDVHFLKKLSESKLSNKRKVDLVHYIIGEYCKTNNNEESNLLFKKYVLLFENKYFLEYKPMLNTNLILQSLVKLNPIFITTNYDKEIEKSIQSIQRYIPKTVPNISEISFDNARPESVLHIHGIPTLNTDLDFFISSSKSYTDLYYTSNYSIFKNNFKSIFKERKNTTVLFVGCSMEEEEVLSLFNFDNPDIEYFALMKYNNENLECEIQKYFNTVVKDYYSERKIKFVWFGDKYSQLGEFLENVVSYINVLNIDNVTSVNEMRNALLGKDG